MNSPRPLKVAISNVTASYAVGGSETYVWALGKFLRARGHDVRVLAGDCERPHHPFTDVPLQLIPFRRRERFPALGSRFRKLMERLSFGWNSKRFLTDERSVDILNIHKPYDLPIAAWIKKRTGCKIIWRCHGRDYFPTLGHWLKRVDAIYCVSEFARQDLLAHYPVEAQVIYTGVDTDFFQPAISGNSSADHRPQVLYFGRLAGWKGVRHLVEAFHQISDLKFTGRIVGEGPEQGGLAQMLNEMKLSNVTL